MSLRWGMIIEGGWCWGWAGAVAAPAGYSECRLWRLQVMAGARLPRLRGSGVAAAPGLPQCERGDVLFRGKNLPTGK